MTDCECDQETPGLVYCPVHDVEKSMRERAICAGNCDLATHLKYMNAWESGAMGCSTCNKPSKGKLPSLKKRAKNFTKAVGKRAAAGFVNVGDEEYASRLEICESNQCGHFNGTHCLKCGCPVKKKAKWATEQCPVGLWPESEESKKK